MSKIALNSNASGNGVFTIASPDSDTDRTLTLPDESGDFVLSASGVISNFTSTGIDDNATSTAITIDASQNVGIGVTNMGSDGVSIPASMNFNVSEGANSSLLNLFRQSSSGATVLANGYKYTDTANKMASSYSSSFAKSAVSLNYGNVIFYTDGATTTASGTDVTPTERMRISSSGNVGIGTTSPGSKLVIEAGDDDGIRIDSTNDTFTGRLSFGDVSDNYIGAIEYDHNVDSMWFYVNNAERMRLDSSGVLLVGTTSHPNSGSHSGVAIEDSSSGTVGRITIGKTSSGNTTAVSFRHNGGVVGSITYSNTATAYNTSSDYRLKENVVNLTGATDRLNQIPVHRFNFIADPDVTVDGFLAHEVADVVPEAISGAKDEVDDEGNPVYQGIDQSKLVPLLTAALQEAVAKIEDLESRLSALETN